MSKNKNPKLCLIDASGYIHRAYHALPPLSNSKGEPMNAVFGFSRMISKILKTEQPDYLGVCFDTPKPTFRHDQYENYKGTRKETDTALISQLPLSEELARTWGLPCLKMDGFEADDVIATLALEGAKKEWDVLILSGDKDILQLVNEHIRVRDEIKNVEYTAEKVKERYGINPSQLTDYFCLMGDKVDNVIGVPGVGDKTASKLIADHGSLEGLFAHLDREKPALQEKLTQFKEQVFKNRDLIRLRADVPLETKPDTLQIKEPNKEQLINLLKRLEFRGNFFGTEGTETVSALEVNTKRKVRVVLSEKDLEELASVLKSSAAFAYDLETTSLDQHRCDLVGMSISVKESEAWYIPIGHHYIGVPQQLSWEKVKSTLGSFFTDSGKMKYGQNMKYDNTVLARFGLEVQDPQFDTMVAIYCVDPSRNGFGLKDLAADFFGERMTHFEEVMGKEKGKTFADVPIPEASSYAGADAEVVIRLVPLFKEKLKQENVESLFNELEMPLVTVIQAMEEAGIRIDVDYLRKLGSRLEEQKKKFEQEIFVLAGEEFSVNSPKQLARILFEKLKMPTGKKTKTGFSTNEEVLSKLADKYPICEKILSYRELAKLISTYVDSLVELADPKTNRVHTSFHQTGAITGRLSSTEPNLQNIPIRTEQGREVRRAFISSPGHILLSADYSQIDLRALAHMSEDPVLIKTFHQGGDVHASTAAEMFHVAPTEVSTEMRRRAKAINFGIVYGQQAWGLSQGLGIEMSEAQDFIKKYFERYAGVRAWIETTLAEARKSGFVSTLSGRKRKVTDINSDNAMARGFAERITINTPIQGTSADIIKAAMIRIFNELKRRNLKSKMLVQVHDELLFEVPESEISQLSALVKEEMESAYQLRVPLIADLKMGSNWTDMEKMKMMKVAA